MKISTPVNLHIPFLHQVTDKFYADGVLTNYRKSQLENAFDMLDINRIQRPIDGVALKQYPILMYSCMKTNLNPYDCKDGKYPMLYNDTIVNMDEYLNEVNSISIKDMIKREDKTAKNCMCATYTGFNSTGINVLLSKKYPKAQDLYNLWETNSVFVDFLWNHSLAVKKTHTQNTITCLFFCLGIRNGRILYL